MDDLEVEKHVWLDNHSQARWVRIMKPAKSLLKFRCVYPHIEEFQKKPFIYLKGDIYMQCWAAPTSTESRLIPDDNLEDI
jgi:hypothetical protein